MQMQHSFQTFCTKIIKFLKEDHGSFIQGRINPLWGPADPCFSHFLHILYVSVSR